MSSDNLFEQIDKVLEKAPENRHSYYQLKYFVLGKEPTTQAQLWQCLKELQSRRETIETIKTQIEDTKDELELIELEIEKLMEDEESLVYVNKKINDLIKKERAIKSRRLKRRQESLNNNINKLNDKLEFLTQEARFFFQAFESLEKIEPLKDYDDYDAQKEYWEAKISEEINLKILTKQPLSTDLIKTALSLHKGSEIKEQVVNILENCKSKMQLICEKEDNARKQITSDQ